MVTLSSTAVLVLSAISSFGSMLCMTLIILFIVPELLIFIINSIISGINNIRRINNI